jgi:hypothetical protein
MYGLPQMLDNAKGYLQTWACYDKELMTVKLVSLESWQTGIPVQELISSQSWHTQKC